MGTTKRVSFNNKVDIHYFDKEEEPHKINKRAPLIANSTIILITIALLGLYYFTK